MSQIRSCFELLTENDIHKKIGKVNNIDMEIKLLNKMFKTGPEKEKTSLYLHKPICDALHTLSKKNGISVSDLVAEILDHYLTDYVNKGYLEAPNVPSETLKPSKPPTVKSKSRGA